MLHLHLRPINQIVFLGSYPCGGKSYLEVGFALRCFQRLSIPYIAPSHALGRQLVHQRYVHPGPLVLRTGLLKFPTPATDRDRTVSRRSEPSSRTTLMGEQPNPWDLLQPQDVMSRHRGAKPPRRCGLLGEISLLSPG
ncbi:cell wall-associated hydrolase domain protein [Clostridioides difficile CD70]|nr:cell wall-associated hydrolase domain protein [Clostridioides difficile CD70]EQG42378.1 cell wall-associated hydrolase domain protein [Clostridioides difficile DA00132]